MQHDNFSEIKKRTERYWYQDGLWEIGFGLANLLLGGFYLLTTLVSWKGPMAIVLSVLQMVVLVGIFLMLGRFVGFLKERITYPRTGYVAYRRSTGMSRLRKIATTALIAAAVAALVGGMAAFRSTDNQVALVSSVIFAGALVFIAYRFSLLRFYALAVLTIGLGTVISYLPIADPMTMTVLFGGYGLLITGSGLITLVLYLRRTNSGGGQDLADEGAANENGSQI